MPSLSFNEFLDEYRDTDPAVHTISNFANDYAEWPKRFRQRAPYEEAWMALAPDDPTEGEHRLSVFNECWEVFESVLAKEGVRANAQPVQEAVVARTGVGEIEGVSAQRNQFPSLMGELKPRDIEMAALVACGLDKVGQAQRVVACVLANRYGLDLYAGHACAVEGQLYIRHRGLLAIAHRHQSFGGIERVSDEEVTLNGIKAMKVTVAVHRKDMPKPFTGVGLCSFQEKQGKGLNAIYQAETRAEVRALRKAFSIDIPAFEDRQVIDIPAAVSSSGEVAEPGQGKVKGLVSEDVQEAPTVKIKPRTASVETEAAHVADQVATLDEELAPAELADDLSAGLMGQAADEAEVEDWKIKVDGIYAIHDDKGELVAEVAVEDAPTTLPVPIGGAVRRMRDVDATPADEQVSASQSDIF